MSHVTSLLQQIESGDPSAADQLLPLVYDELRLLATARLVHERPGQTLQATALVHEAYLRLVGAAGSQRWESRGHFFAAAAEAIRRILIEKARRKRRVRHGGGRSRVDLDQAVSVVDDPGQDLLDLDEALDRFSELDPVKARLVKLRYFAGCSLDEAADLLGVSRSTAKRHWAYARAWLLAELHDGDDSRNP